jgi:hypothetical protein
VAFPSLARESLVLRPEGRWNLTVATAGGATHRPAVRRPDPSALLAGAPTRISRSNASAPRAKRNSEGGQGRVKAMFPLARRVCPAQDGRTTSMEFPVMSRASGQARLDVHRFTGTATGAMARMFAAWSGCAAPSSQPPTPARCRSTGTYSNARPGRAFPAGEPCHRSWNRTLVPSSGEDLRPWWPTARYLPRSTRTSSPPRNSQWPRRRLLLPIFIRQGWPQAMSHLPAVPSACPSQTDTSSHQRSTTAR